MREALKNKLLHALGYANYHRLVDIKNSILNTQENKKHKESLSRMTAFYSGFLKQDDLCFDIGANMGNRIAAFLEIGARVIAVEPQDKCCDYLRKKYGNKITLISKGCGEKEETKDFYISDASTISSFSEEWINKVKEGRFKEHTWNKKVQVHLTTLDKLIKQYGKPRFIKIDVEGFEPDVLKGLSMPVPMISFEYAEPEQHMNTIEYIKKLYSIDNAVQFNYSVGESMLLEHKNWMSLNQMVDFIETKDFVKSGFGDIYVKYK